MCSPGLTKDALYAHSVRTQPYVWTVACYQLESAAILSEILLDLTYILMGISGVTKFMCIFCVADRVVSVSVRMTLPPPRISLRGPVSVKVHCEDGS